MNPVLSDNCSDRLGNVDGQFSQTAGKKKKQKKKKRKKETEKIQRSPVMLQDDVLLLATQFLPGHLTASQTCCSKSCLCYLIPFQDVSSVGERKFLPFFLVPLMTRLTKTVWQL